MNEEVKEIEETEETEVKETSMVVANVDELAGRNRAVQRVFTTLDLNADKKKIFNLENNCDYKFIFLNLTSFFIYYWFSKFLLY